MKFQLGIFGDFVKTFSWLGPVVPIRACQLFDSRRFIHFHANLLLLQSLHNLVFRPGLFKIWKVPKTIEVSKSSSKISRENQSKSFKAQDLSSAPFILEKLEIDKKKEVRSKNKDPLRELTGWDESDRTF